MPHVQAGALRLHYVESGTGSEPLVFIHGYTSSHRNWRETLPRLPDRYRAIALDLRGAGDSESPPTGFGPQYYADDIALATRALGLDTFTLIGHSMGGVTGMQFALRYPERLRKLVLVAPAPASGLELDPALHEMSRQMRRNREARLQVARAMAVRPLADELHVINFEDDLRWSDTAWEEAWQAMLDLRLGEELAQIQTPTLMVVGDRDFLRAYNLADAARIPNCALHVFYRVGHLIPFDVPEEFVALIDDFVQHGTAPPPVLPAIADQLAKARQG